MRLLHVTGDNDFAAIEFENYFKGKSIKEIIERFFDNEEEHDGDFEMELFEFDDVDPKFITYLRNNGLIDYDYAKHTNFYIENETYL